MPNFFRRKTAILALTKTAELAEASAHQNDLAIKRVEATVASGYLPVATYDAAGIAQQVVGTTASQTVTNKTLTSPTINTPTLVLADAAGAAPTADGAIKFDRTGENLEVGDGSGTKSFSHDTGTATLQNKSISLTNNTLTGTTAEFNTALTDGSFATLAGTETLTNKTLTTPTLVLPNSTVAGLPGSPSTGQVHLVTDANATTQNSIVAGSGSNVVLVFFDGTNWRIA